MMMCLSELREMRGNRVGCMNILPKPLAREKIIIKISHVSWEMVFNSSVCVYYGENKCLESFVIKVLTDFLLRWVSMEILFAVLAAGILFSRLRWFHSSSDSIFQLNHKILTITKFYANTSYELFLIQMSHFIFQNFLNLAVISWI